ncbi:hypothetical protein OAS47_01190 [Pelagibacteraceae bacterium]|nr:hypothetical protein [Pelagibacteraceae bacterium]
MIKKDTVKLLSINNLKKISKKIQSFKHISFVWNTLLIISVALIVYLVLPKIFNYQKKESLIVESINKNYGIKLENLSDISYSFFPTPKLILKNPNFTFKKNSLQGKAEEILLKINISDLYSNEEINIKKIYIIKSDLKISTSNFKTFIGNLDLIKNKILIKNSSLYIVSKDKLLTLKNLSFENSDKKLFLNANLFDQKIELIFIKNVEGNRLNLKIPEIGLQTNIVFSEQSNMNLLDGSLRMKILNNNIKLNFINKKNNFIITKSIFKNNKIHSSFDGYINLYPYFNFDILFDVKNINTNEENFKKMLKSLNKFFEINEKFNGNFKVNYKKKKYQTKIVQKANLDISLKNRDIIIKRSSLKFIGGELDFSGLINNFKSYKRLNFDLKLKIDKKNNLLNNYNIEIGKNLIPLKLIISGTYNFSSKKINFNKILFNNNYEATEADKKKFKKKFENLIITNDLEQLISIDKINNFIKELS